MHFQARSLPRSTFEPDVNVEVENKPLTIARPVYLESENRAEKRYVDRISLDFLKVYYLSFFLSFFLQSIRSLIIQKINALLTSSFHYYHHLIRREFDLNMAQKLAELGEQKEAAARRKLLAENRKIK